MKIFKSEHFYFLKPFLPRNLQLYIRRVLVRQKIPKYADVWPIDQNSAEPPENWKGWPEGKKFALVLTHDVETQAGLSNCLQLAEMEKDLNLRSSFNFVAKDYHTPEDLRHYLTNQGFEIGLHGLYHNEQSFRSEDLFRKQKPEIIHYLKDWGSVGFRSPSMFHNLDYVHELNVEYDSSTFDTDPFEPQPDGLGTIFPKWISKKSTTRGYIELPYTLPQDFLLFILMKEKTIDIWKKKLDWIAQHGGMALMDVHPDYITFGESAHKNNQYPARLYREFLDYVCAKYEGQYWHVLPKEMARFWSTNYRGNDMQGKSVSTIEKKKIWIDLDNSPHVPFFKPIIAELKKRKYEVVITARDCFQVCGLADLMNVEYEKIGHHYGKNLFLKGIGLVIRSAQLVPTTVHEKPDLALSHGSRSQVMTSTLLNIPSVVIGDYEYAQTVIKPTYVFCPELIPDSSVKGYKKAVFKYPGIKEDVYVPDFIPDPSILNQLGINDGELLVTIRPPATEAHYHNPESEILFEATINLLGEQNNTRMVILPRNEKKQTAWVKSNWAAWCDSGKIIIPEHVVDGLNLIWHSDFVISGGGTMNREAAALDVPVYSIFRGTIGAIDRYLSENGRLILLTSVDDVKNKIKIQERSRVSKLENINRDALSKIVEHIETILENS